MKHLANIYDPRQSDAKATILTHSEETRAEAWASQQAWLADKVIGRPAATKFYTVEQLEKMHMVGVYAHD